MVLDGRKRTAEEELAFAEELAVAHVALQLADLLQNCETTQQELAQQVGVSPGRISQILSADGNPTVKTIARIAKALGRVLRVEFVVPEGTTKL